MIVLAEWLFQQRQKPNRPAVDRRMVDRYAADGRSTSIGSVAVERFLRQVSYRDLSDEFFRSTEDE